MLARAFDGHAPRTHVASDLTYVRAGGSWCCVCLLVDLYNREIVGCDVVELAPIPGLHHADFTAAKLTQSLMGLMR